MLQDYRIDCQQNQSGELVTGFGIYPPESRIFLYLYLKAAAGMGKIDDSF